MSDIWESEPIEPAAEELALVLQRGAPSASDADLVKVLPESVGLAKRIVAGMSGIEDAEDKLPLSALAEEVATVAMLGDISAAISAIEEALA